jgi:hypothetical protein
MTLDDIDWHAGELTVRGKGETWERLPCLRGWPGVGRLPPRGTSIVCPRSLSENSLRELHYSLLNSYFRLFGSFKSHLVYSGSAKS